ncbi:MAG TPA: metallophosphoesterase, partial [Chloroflexota bacterium]|nr:metallophosphoesterase [Chloroflexota bacterium]
DAVAFEPSRLRVQRLMVPSAGSGSRKVSLRLAQLSDLHVGGRGWRHDVLARAIDVCNREDEDAIVITGDLIVSEAGADEVLRAIARLRSDVPRLVVFGNHDHVHGGRALAHLGRGLDRLGMAVLRNDVVRLELPAGPVWFAGVDDGYSMRDRLELVREKMAGVTEPRILLTHYPEVADRLRSGEFQLSLAGHSHGGQIRMPIVDTLVCNSHARTRYARGLYIVNENPLYVSTGLGMSGVPMRFRNWPEMSLIYVSLIY